MNCTEDRSSTSRLDATSVGSPYEGGVQWPANSGPTLAHTHNQGFEGLSLAGPEGVRGDPVRPAARASGAALGPAPFATSPSSILCTTAVPAVDTLWAGSARETFPAIAGEVLTPTGAEESERERE